MNVASRSGHLHLSPGFEWIGSHYTSIAFGTATLVEVLAYTIPWLDHILDLVATPAAIVAGIIATASMVMDLSPFLKWTLALIAGGGAAAIVQGVTVLLRTKSSALTAGTGNVFVSSLELDWIYPHGPLGHHRPDCLRCAHFISLHFCDLESRPSFYWKDENKVKGSYAVLDERRVPL